MCCDEAASPARTPSREGLTAPVRRSGILAPGPLTARLQLRDSAGVAPDFPQLSPTLR